MQLQLTITTCPFQIVGRPCFSTVRACILKCLISIGRCYGGDVCLRVRCNSPVPAAVVINLARMACTVYVHPSLVRVHGTTEDDTTRIAIDRSEPHALCSIGRRQRRHGGRDARTLLHGRAVVAWLPDDRCPRTSSHRAPSTSTTNPHGPDRMMRASYPL